jgi:hypothetical protein
MVKISTHSLFGKKPLVEEQLILLESFEQAGLGCVYADPTILDSYSWDILPTIMGKDKRKELAKRHFSNSVKLINNIL